MKKMLIGLAVLLALSGTALAADFADTLHYPSAEAVKLDNSTTGSIKTGTADKKQAPAPARPVMGGGAIRLPVDNLR